MRIDAETIDDSHVIAVVGELDRTLAPRLMAEVDRSESRRLVLDLTDMSFMDSSGLGAILYAWTRTANRDGRLIIVCPLDAHVRRTFDMRGVGRQLTVVETRAEALAAV
jgi:anti-anti-sigma factor